MYNKCSLFHSKHHRSVCITWRTIGRKDQHHQSTIYRQCSLSGETFYLSTVHSKYSLSQKPSTSAPQWTVRCSLLHDKHHLSTMYRSAVGQMKSTINRQYTWSALCYMITTVYRIMNSITVCYISNTAIRQYSRTSMARTTLGPQKTVRDMGSSSQWGLIIVPGQEAKIDNLGNFFFIFFTILLYVECTH